MTGDALWYEAAQVVGITNALNVVADGLGRRALAGRAGGLAPRGESRLRRPAGLLRDAAGGEIPTPFALAAYEPGYLADLWVTVRHTFTDRQLSRRLKEALAFAVSLTSRSAFGTGFHLSEMRRLGVSERGVMEVTGVTQMFSSYTKIADTLQLESDMHDIAPADSTPAPGGERSAARGGGRAASPAAVKRARRPARAKR